MLKVPSTYKLGNHHSFRKSKTAKPLVYGDASIESGELISGLKGEEWVKEHYDFDGWHKEKKLFISTLTQLHRMMIDYHQKFVKKAFEAK